MLLLESNPLRGLKTPSEKNPTRVIITQAEYEALLRVVEQVDWRFRVALVLAHETGHRIGAICQLRWCDIDLDTNSISGAASTKRRGTSTGRRLPPWRRPSDGSAEAQPRNRGCAGDASAEGALGVHDPLASEQLVEEGRKARGTLTQVGPGVAFGPAEIRFRSHGPAAQGVLRSGRWKTAQTVLQCYQRPDEDRLRKALEAYREVGSASN